MAQPLGNFPSITTTNDILNYTSAFTICRIWDGTRSSFWTSTNAPGDWFDTNVRGPILWLLKSPLPLPMWRELQSLPVLLIKVSIQSLDVLYLRVCHKWIEIEKRVGKPAHLIPTRQPCKIHGLAIVILRKRNIIVKSLSSLPVRFFQCVVHCVLWCVVS